MNPDSSLKSVVYHFIQSVQTVLSSSKNSEHIYSNLNSLSSLLPKSKKFNEIFPEDCIGEAKTLFINHYYVSFIKFLFDQGGSNWLEKLSPAQQGEVVDVFFLEGLPQDAFLVLCHVAEKSEPSSKRDKCVQLLELFISKHQLASMFWELCCVNVSPYSTLEKEFWDQLISVISSLPSRMANVLQRKNLSIFYPMQYFRIVAEDILTVLAQVHERLSKSQDCSIGFLSFVVGKICMVGYADILLTEMISSFSKLTETDFIWRRICEKFFESIPDINMESVVVSFIKIVPWYGVINRLLGDLVLKHRKLSFLLTNKLMLMKHFNQGYIIHNIIGHLGSSPSRKALLIKVLLNLLDVWGNKSAVKHSPYDQHLYISKCILSTLAYLNEKDKQDIKEQAFSKVVAGVGNHLESPHYPMRRLGMIVSENVTQVIDPSGPVLKFEYEKDDEVKELLSLLIPPEDPSIKQITSEVKNLSTVEEKEVINSNTEIKENCETTLPIIPSSETEVEELDSDDDLIPYDMSHDAVQVKVKTPLYIRDCMEGLLSSEEADKIEICLQEADKLIRLRPDDLLEVSVEFMKILLHLQDNFEIRNFVALRMGAAVALTSLCPTVVADYLTEQFYAKEYNLLQRMEILDILVTASRELSELPHHNAKTVVNKADPLPVDGVAVSENWQDIVAKRVEANTKRFGKGVKKPLPEPVENRFAPVAGRFFFPLMRDYDRKQNTMDLLGEDVLMLGKLLLALGSIMNSAKNIHMAAMMGKSLLDFIAGLRYHSDSYVRKGLIYCVHSVLQSVSPQILVTEYMNCLMENCNWLSSVIENDYDADCQQLALQTMLALQNIFKKEAIGLDSGS